MIKSVIRKSLIRYTGNTCAIHLCQIGRVKLICGMVSNRTEVESISRNSIVAKVWPKADFHFC